MHKISPHLFSGTFEWAITSPLSRMRLRVKRGLKKINVKRRELSLIISDYVSGLCARKLPRRSQIQFKAEDKSAPSSRGVHAPPQLKNSTLITLSARRRIEFTQSCVAKFLPALPLCVQAKWTKCSRAPRNSRAEVLNKQGAEMVNALMHIS